MVPSRFGEFHCKYRRKNKMTRVICSILVPSRFSRERLRRVLRKKAADVIHLQIYIFSPPHLPIYIFSPSHLQI